MYFIDFVLNVNDEYILNKKENQKNQVIALKDVKFLSIYNVLSNGIINILLVA